MRRDVAWLLFYACFALLIGVAYVRGEDSNNPVALECGTARSVPCSTSNRVVYPSKPQLTPMQILKLGGPVDDQGKPVQESPKNIPGIITFGTSGGSPTISTSIAACPPDRPHAREITDYSVGITCTLVACIGDLFCAPDRDGECYREPSNKCNRCTTPPKTTICLSSEELTKSVARWWARPNARPRPTKRAIPYINMEE